MEYIQDLHNLNIAFPALPGAGGCPSYGFRQKEELVPGSVFGDASLLARLSPDYSRLGGRSSFHQACLLHHGSL